MSARPVVKHSAMLPEMQEIAIQVAQDAIAANNTEQVLNTERACTRTRTRARIQSASPQWCGRAAAPHHVDAERLCRPPPNLP